MTPLQTTQAALDSCKSKPQLLMDHTDIFEGFSNEADEATKEKLDIEVSDDKNLYHLAVEIRNTRAVKILNKLLTVEQREKYLKQMRYRGRWEQIRGGICGVSACCKTPVHMAIGQWAEKRGDKKMYEALLEGLPPRVIITVLEADDEKCRDAFDIAKSCREKNKSREIMQRLSSDIGMAKKTIADLESEVDVQRQEKISAQMENGRLRKYANGRAESFKRHKEKEKEQSLEIQKYKQKAVQAKKDKKAFHNLYSNHLLGCPSVFQHQRTFSKDSAISDSYTNSVERLDIFYNTENMPRKHVYQPSSTGKPGQLTTTPIQPQSDRYDYCYHGGGSSRSLSYNQSNF